LELQEPNVALAPLLGALKVTDAPETGLPNASVTWATSALANAVLTVADWPPPETVVMLLAAAGVIVTEVVPQLVEPFLAVIVGLPAISSP
jgi:hypothetical protein